MINIFEYADYRQYLRDLFDEKKRRSPAFSHRVLARQLGLSTSNYIMLIMQGKRNLNTDLRYKISTVFKHGTREAEYFEHLVNFGHAKTDSEKSYHFAHMLSMRKSLKLEVLRDSHYEYLSTWYNPVIRELVTDPEWNGDFQVLAKAVRPQITAAQAKKSVKLLLKCGLISLENGKYVQSSPVVSTEKGIVSMAITGFHREMSKRAFEILDSTDRENRSITGCTLHISRASFEAIREELAQCRSKILAIAQADDEADRVFHLNLQLFPVSTPMEKEEKRTNEIPDQFNATIKHHSRGA